MSSYHDSEGWSNLNKEQDRNAFFSPHASWSHRRSGFQPVVLRCQENLPQERVKRIDYCLCFPAVSPPEKALNFLVERNKACSRNYTYRLPSPFPSAQSQVEGGEGGSSGIQDSIYTELSRPAPWFGLLPSQHPLGWWGVSRAPVRNIP